MHKAGVHSASTKDAFLFLLCLESRPAKRDPEKKRSLWQDSGQGCHEYMWFQRQFV